jgi:hypothetical protein
MRKSSPIARAASYAGGGGLAAAQQVGSPVPNLATQGSSQQPPGGQHRPGPVQRPAEGRSAAEQKKHRPGRSGWKAHPKAGSPVLYDLPGTIVNVVPQYRGFKCLVVQDELIIVDPGTRHRSRSSPA